MSENVSYTLNVNGQNYPVTADSGLPLLWVLRDVIGLTGTKYGCGITQCKACSVLVDGVLERSCDFDAKNAAGKKVVTVEGLATDPVGSKLQQAWVDEQVPQCGYCQSGMLIAATALAEEVPAAVRREHQRVHGQHLRLRHVQPRPQGHQARGGCGMTSLESIAERSRSAASASSPRVSSAERSLLGLDFAVSPRKAAAAGRWLRAGG